MAVSRVLRFGLLLGPAGCQLIAGLEGERELGLGAGGVAASAGQTETAPLPLGGGSAEALGGAATLGEAGSGDRVKVGVPVGDGGSGGREDVTAGGSELTGQAGAEPDRAVPLTTPSCADLVPLGCGTVNPCLTIPVAGGEFMMGRNEDGTRADYYPTGGVEEVPEHGVTVSPYVLDKYEVTVGRFRRFVDAYVLPKEGAGAHPKIFGSGWNADWNVLLPTNQAALRKGLTAADPEVNTEVASWTDQPGAGECRPMNAINWYLAFAFCIWDGGRLPAEAEWEFAAAGGAQERIFPWGSASPEGRVVFGCAYSGSLSCTAGDLPRVGSFSPLGDGRFGHADLAGSVGEPARDAFDPSFYSSRGATSTDALNLGFFSSDPAIAIRGGNGSASGDALRTGARMSLPSSSRGAFFGVRCARNP